MQPLKPPTRRLLADLLSVEDLDSGRPWLPGEVLPPLPSGQQGVHLRCGRNAGLLALQRRGLVGRTADGRYYLTPRAVAGGQS